MIRRPFEQLDPAYLQELKLHVMEVADKPGGTGMGYRATWQRAQLFRSCWHVMSLAIFGHQSQQCPGTPDDYGHLSCEETRPLIKDVFKKDLANIAFGTMKAEGENDCFLPLHKFYYARFHYKNVRGLGCVFITQTMQLL